MSSSPWTRPSRCATRSCPATTAGIPHIPPAVTVKPGQSIRVECKEWTDNQIGNNDPANDVCDVDLSVAHMLSGPIGVEGAEPGDLLVVDILDLVRCRRRPVSTPGRAGVKPASSPSTNGGGFLTDRFPDAYKAIWDFSGNHDIKNFSRGSRVLYPVHVPGALLCGGDLHFGQGDGEITFCGAIEMGVSSTCTST